MAQFDVFLFEEFALAMGDKSHNLTSDSFSIILSSSYPTVADLTPDSADYTECTNGGGYTTGGIALTTSYVESGGVGTFDSTTNPSWTKAAGSPEDIKVGLIVNTTHTGSTDLVGFIDLTPDGGTTPVSLVLGSISITWNASGIFNLTVS